MRATLHQLKVFRQVAISMNYTKAADKLGLSQPAVSIQLKQLENNLDIFLFEKIGKTLFLTPAGKELKVFCDELFISFDNIDMTLSGLKGELAGDFCLSAVTSAKYFTPHLLGAFHKLHPKVNFHLDIVNREQIIQRLHENKDDLVIMGLIPETMALTKYPFVDNPIILIASPQHALAKCKHIPLSELSEHAFIHREKGSGTRKAFEQFLKDKNVPLKVNMTLGNSETIKQAVMADLGISVVSRHSVTLELATGILVELKVEGFPLVRSWYLVHHESKHLSPIAKAFIDFVLSAEKNVPALRNRFLEQHFFKKT
ncbi:MULTISPECIES: LysR family transcriptional regulator [Psychromonas]|uniref:LysR family transcriptional regulator n=1 Tax=Psychromonas TaxID=67572 RepID=UPI0003F5BBB2|nr:MULTISPECIES: LysR family transcriptional regulator [Psychromonas]MBB1274283.1 LysR family transcriptional regulator [Psychromonas sp. SR45-3]